MIHTSTAYCNLILPEIEEKIHPIDFDPHAVISLCENFPDEVLKEVRNLAHTKIFSDMLIISSKLTF